MDESPERESAGKLKGVAKKDTSNKYYTPQDKNHLFILMFTINILFH